MFMSSSGSWESVSVIFGMSLEFPFTSVRTEVVRPTLIFEYVPRLLFINLHAAYWIFDHWPHLYQGFERPPANSGNQGSEMAVSISTLPDQIVRAQSHPKHERPQSTQSSDPPSARR